MQIYILNRARETLATTASIYNDKHTLTLEAGSSSYEFTIDKSDEASHYMDSGNYIVLQDDKGKTWLFTILDYEETHSAKTVYAEDAGVELINKAVDIWKGDEPHPFSYYFDLVTKGTPWKLGVNQLAGLERTLTYEGRDTGLGRLLSILKGFDNAECTFDVTVKMNAPAEFKINVYKQVGNDRSDVQIVYNNELNDITKKESRAEFVTALAGVGGQIQTEDGSEGGNVDFSELEYNKDGFVTKKGDKFLRAVDANRTFNPGQESYIESFYEYDTQSPSELLNRTLSKLKTYSEPQYTYTADVKVIDSSLVLGDTVTILDHDYNPALYLSARVAKLVKSYTDPAQNEIEFTNYRLLNSALADKLARLQVIVNALPSASRVSAIETNLIKLTKQQEEVIVKVESANGKNTNYYGGSQPENAKQGDSWFYTDEEGNQGIKQYQDGVWVDVISSKFGPKLEADIKQTQDDMQGLSDEVEEARNKAQEAFAKAGFNADEISIIKTATSEVTKTLTSTVRQASELSESLKDVASETASRYSTVSSELSGAKNSLTAKASELAREVASNSANITKANSQLYSQSEGLAKVSQSATKMEQTMTDLSGRVHTVETTASETKEALTDAKGNITTLTERADGTDTKIADAQGRVQTLESRADTWDLELSKKVDNTTYNAGIQNLGNQINLKANKSDLDGYATKAQLSVESDRITQQAGEIVTVRNLANTANNKIDGLRIGGRNLLKNSRGRFQPNGSKLDNFTVYKDTTAYLENGKTYTISAKAKDGLVFSSVHEPTKQSNKVTLWMVDTVWKYNIVVSDDKTNTVGTVFKWGYPTDTYQLRVNTYNADNSGYAEYVQIQEGTRATEWQPSDLDLPTTIISTVTTTTNAKQIVDSSGIYSEVTKLVDTKVGNVTTQLDSYKHTVDDTGDKLRDVMGALKLDSNGNLTSNFNELIKTASGVEERYTQLSGKIDGIVVGGKNLLDGTATMGNNGVFTITSSSASNWSEGYVFAVKEPTLDGEQYILSFDAMASTNGYRMQNHWYHGGISGSSNPAKKITDQDGNVVSVGGDGATFTTLTTSWKRYWYLIDTGNSGGETRIIIGRLNDRYKTGPGWVKIRKAQLEKGNKPSDWGMSDNDIKQKIAEANASIAKTNETIKTVDGNVTTVKNNLDKTKSVVTQLANLFDVTVGDSSISVTNGGVLVKGKQIHIDGQTLIDNGVIQGAKIADASIGTAKIADAAITSAKIANLDVNKLSGNKSTFVQSVWNGISGNNAKLTNSGIESVSGANRTVISGGKIETNSIITKNTIHVGQEDPDPRKQWGVDIDNKGFWFGTPVKQPGHTTNNPSDYRYELQGAIRGYGSDYTQNDATGSGTSGLVIGLAEQSMWGNPYGGDFFAIGRYVKNSTQALETASFDPAISYNATNAGFGAYNDTVNIWKNTYVRGYFSAEYEDKTRFYVGANDGDVLFILQDKNNKNVIIDSSTHTSNGLIVKGSQNITNWLGCQDLSVRGNKNSVVQTSQGWTKINAYETAEYYFGDLGTTNTGANSLVRIDIDPIFKETVNTNVKYQVFLTSYGHGYAWVSERTENYFVIESNTPNLEVGYEIKAKRKGYEGVRLEIDRNMEGRTND
ncbi:hypothetical protein [Ligilactobacillus agilis]|uniref:hypothetical protein n=1 Tax=Ligilactobacillus agilis TaxID=1601 RepID=UPI00242B0A39|nr:hypothetical protein [Ligilactobacillus agilis]